MKCSKYNVIVEIEKHNNYLLYNTLSGALIEAETDAGHLLESYAEGKSVPTDDLEELGPERLKMLVENGFLVEDLVDEVAIVQALDSTRLGVIHANQSALNLTLVPSLQCNFNCFYCFEPEWLRNKSSVMDAKTQDKVCLYVKNTLDKPEVRTVSITWFGGEPLMFPKIIESMQGRINQIALERGRRTENIVVTNGFFLDKDASDMLVEHNILSAQITLDGPAKIHNKRRLYRENREANFETIVRNIGEANNALNIVIRVNVGRHNVDAPYELLEELIELGVWPHRIRDIYLAYLNGVKDTLSRSEFLKIDEEFRVYKVKRFNELVKNKIAKLAFELPSKRDVGSCMHMVDEHQTWVIDSAGDVYRCWDVTSQKAHRVGTIDGLLADKIKDLENWVINEEIREETGCYKCKMSPVCGIACPSQYFTEREAGEYHGKHEIGNPFCSDWKFGIEHKLASQYMFYRKYPELVYNFPPKIDNHIPELIAIEGVNS